MHILIWVLALFALGLWTLLAWGMSAVLGLEAGWTGDIGTLLQGLPWAGLVEAWVPGGLAVLTTALELLRGSLGWIGGFGKALIWGVWAVGALIVLVGAGLLSLVVVMVRRHSPPSPPAPA